MYLEKSTFTGKRSVAYLRKSTDDSYRQKYSIQSQREQMEQWAAYSGVIVDEYFVDDHSAKTFERPGWERLMAYLLKHHAYIRLVLIIDYSRFSRNDVLAYVSINQLDKWGIELQAIDQLLNYEVPESLIMRGNYITMPAVDNKWRSIKVRRGMVQSLKAGNWCAGKPPRGYWRDKNTNTLHLTEEGRLIGMAFDKIAHHGYNIRDTQVFLNLRGIDVTFKALSKMLRNPFYKGSISHALLGTEVVRGNQPPATDPATWTEVQHFLDGNKKSGCRDDLFPLKKFMGCAVCGTLFTGYQIRKKQKPDGSYREKKSQPIYYKCKCSNVPGTKMHEDFMEILDGLCLNPAYVPAFREHLVSTWERMQAESTENTAIVKKRLTEERQFLSKLERRYINGDLDMDTETYRKHKQESTEKVAELEKRVGTDKKISNPTLFIDEVMRLLTKMPKIWQERDIMDKRILQNQVFPAGLSYDKRKDEYLTPAVGSVFGLLTSFSGDYKQKTRLASGASLVYSPSVVRRGIEPLLPG